MRGSERDGEGERERDAVREMERDGLWCGRQVLRRCRRSCVRIAPGESTSTCAFLRDTRVDLAAVQVQEPYARGRVVRAVDTREDQLGRVATTSKRVEKKPWRI